VYQIRIHGRGGQGVVTAAEMLSVAAFTEGHHAQAFPSFGSERTGAPVVAFARIDNKEIRLREPVFAPDVILVQDKTLLEVADVFGGVRPDGYVLINSSESPEEMGLQKLVDMLPPGHVMTVPATRFALEKIGRPLPGAAMLAGFAAMTGVLKLENVQAAYSARFGGRIAQANADVAQAAYEYIMAKRQEAQNA
jgi:pyruvate ferredoxin oxidoreductase gamma subunit